LINLSSLLETASGTISSGTVSSMFMASPEFFDCEIVHETVAEKNRSSF
jgi:hypothetical protein